MKAFRFFGFAGLSVFALVSCGGQSASASGLSVSQSASPSASASASGLSSSQSRTTSSTLPDYSRLSYSGSDYPAPPAQEWTLKANKPTNPLRGDFAFGVDVSSVAEVEKNGGKYYNKEGQEEDLFRILAEGGSNYARFRLWNDPHDTLGHPYGGGTNDVETDIALAKRAKAAGMKVLIDFHYSDSWADPGKFYAPKAWSSMFFDEKLMALAEFTRTSLQKFKDAGVTVDAVQLGNEINPGIAGAPSGSAKNMYRIIKSAMNATRVVFPEAKTIAHFTDINTPKKIYNIVDALQSNGGIPDVIGVSYYPYWHGSLDNLQSVLNALATYGCEVMVLETSWGFTDEEHEAAGNQFNSNTLGQAGGYATSTQAQVTELADIVDVLSKVPNQKGTGIFYWEPAWLPVWGAGWISKYGAYYNETGQDWVGNLTEAELDSRYDQWYCRTSWANQALFDYEGHVLPSASAYRHIAAGDHPLEEQLLAPLNERETFKVNISEPFSLSSTVRFTTNLDAYRDVPVTWNQDDLDAIVESGKYVVHGIAEGQNVVADVTAIRNYIVDPSFESVEGNKPVAVPAPWHCETTANYKTVGDAHVACDGELGARGNHYFHFYSTSPWEFELTQNLGTIAAGVYDFGVEANTCWYGGDNDGNATIDLAKFYYIVNGEKVELDIREQFIGYNNGKITEIAFPTITLESDSEISIGLAVKGGAKAWGHMDNFYFADHTEA